jgi:hypothetical protein
VPVITGGAVGGSTVITVTGIGAGCTPTKIQVFDCGPDKICYNGDDFELAVVSASYSNGTFTIVLVNPLVPGQRIYVTNGCVDPVLSSEPEIVRQPAPVPALSGSLLLALEALLGLVGLYGLSRLRRT